MTLRPPVLLLAATLSALLLVGEARAWGALRCGDALASTGDSVDTVRKLCGNPDEISQFRHGGRVYDKWVYDFGPNRFVEMGFFLHGRLYFATNGDYGKKPVN